MGNLKTYRNRVAKLKKKNLSGLAFLGLSLLACDSAPPRAVDFEGGWGATSGKKDFIIISSRGDEIVWEDAAGTFSAELEGGVLRIHGEERVAELDSRTGRLQLTSQGEPTVSYEPVPAGSIREAMDLAHAASSIRQMRSVGTAIVAWVTDNVVAPSAGSAATIRPVTRDELSGVLVPTYLGALPETDGWGNAFEYHVALENPGAESFARIVSGGADGSAATESDNIEWSDGFFIRYPGG